MEPNEAACDIEETWSKKQILEAYLNLVTYRGELQGIAAASRALLWKKSPWSASIGVRDPGSMIRAPNASFEETRRRSVLLSEPCSGPWKSQK